VLRHKDVRVRRETIRALTKIGGQSAVGILLRAVEEADPDLRRQALLSLGAMKNPAAVPTLLRLLTQPDLLLKKVDVRKEAARALGEIGSPEATPALVDILRHRRFWGRSTYDELRTVAAQALGDLRDPAAIQALEKATGDRSNDVARAAVQALNQMTRGEEHGPGTA
jgi:HEAT repeat protein